MIENEKQIEIPLSRTKMTLTLLGALVFVLFGLWFLINPLKSNYPAFGNSNFIFIVGILSVIFFGIIAITIIRKFLDKKAGLIISKDGLTDNSSGVSAGFIPWSDIQEITVTQVMNQKFLMIIVNNPQYYLDKVTNPIKRSAMKMNYKTYGSPISISSNALQTDFEELYRMLVIKMIQSKS